MPIGIPSVPARVGVSVTVGLASLVGLFATCVAVLGETKRLDYGSGIAALLACCLAASAVATMGMFGQLNSYLTGEKRQTFLRVAAWGSVLLPLATFLESAFLFTMSFWWFLFPAQFVVGGLPGLAVAILRGRWWFGLWGVIATAWGVLWVATGLFWAK